MPLMQKGAVPASGAVAKGAVVAEYVSDSTAPTFSSAVIPTAGTTCVVTLTEADSVPVLPASGVTGFSVDSDGGNLSVASATRTGDTEITLSLNRVCSSIETVTLSYSSGNVTDGAANDLGDLTDESITNNSTQDIPVGGGGINQFIGGGFIR